MLTRHVFPQDPCQACIQLHFPNVIMSTSPTTNLPDPAYTAVLTCYVSREINAPLETVWDVLSDFPKYPDW